jgi:hypothetical protein
MNKLSLDSLKYVIALSIPGMGFRTWHFGDIEQAIINHSLTLQSYKQAEQVVDAYANDRNVRHASRLSHYMLAVIMECG